jgi:DNA-binding CsgD family transcriptional regulator
VNLDQERYQILQDAGRVSEIKETLLIPIRQDGQIVATLSLDNFETVNAFTPQQIAKAEELGVVFGIGVKLQDYQERLVKKQQNENIQANIAREPEQTSAILEILLCPRDIDVLNCLVEGLTNKQIARKLDIAVTSVNKYATTLFQKIGVHSRAQAVRWAEKHKHNWQ